MAGLVGVGLALAIGLANGEAHGAMMREIGGATLGLLIFWAGRMIESR